MLHFELLDEMFDHSVVNVLTPQVAVSCCGLYLKDSIFDVEQGDIKGAATKVEDQDPLLHRFICH
jgi:NAD-specific glutamate dehydrogenase